MTKSIITGKALPSAQQYAWLRAAHASLDSMIALDQDSKSDRWLNQTNLQASAARGLGEGIEGGHSGHRAAIINRVRKSRRAKIVQHGKTSFGQKDPTSLFIPVKFQVEIKTEFDEASSTGRVITNSKDVQRQIDRNQFLTLFDFMDSPEFDVMNSGSRFSRELLGALEDNGEVKLRLWFEDKFSSAHGLIL